MRHLRSTAIAVLFSFSLVLVSLTAPPLVQGEEPGADVSRAEAAAGWIARQLATSDDVVVTGGATDWGQTIDALFALASAGVAGDQIEATANKIFSSGEAYIGAASDKDTSWPAIAKMVLALQVSGLDTSAFPVPGGTRDLIADLRSVLNADGSFGAEGTDNIYSHPLAMLALARTDVGVPPQVVTWMIDQQCSDTTSADYGSFGWAECMMADIDSTALAAQALAASGVSTSSDSPLTAAQTWLLSQQQVDGGFESWGATNTNSTGLAAQTLGSSHPASVATAQEFIGGLQVTCPVILDHDSTLVQADVGAIAYNDESFQTIVDHGLDVLTSQTLMSTTQAILGLGGPDYAHLTSNGASAGIPTPSCRNSAPTPGPSNPANPAQPNNPPAFPPSGPVVTQPPTAEAPNADELVVMVNTGGTTTSPRGLIWAGFMAGLGCGVGLLRKKLVS
ncbi:MAG: hypothetical protein FWG15_03025 [Propionibacteriaceae bacterium]|nr:hypothetical protein [Propionibacteriaceae bacterium]